MKALTIWQPHASLYAVGPKDDESRGWAPRGFSGPLAVHAGKHDPSRDELAALAPELRETQRRVADLIACGAIEWTRVMPTSAVIAVVESVDVWRATSFRGEDDDGNVEWIQDVTGVRRPVSMATWRSSDLSPGRFGWRRGAVKLLREPVPCRGRQGLFTLPPDVESAVLAQLERATTSTLHGDAQD